jgi:hypothetical protein
MFYKYTKIVPNNVGIRIVQRATPMLVDRLNVSDVLELFDFVPAVEEDLVVTMGVGILVGCSKTVLATFVGAS